MAVVVVADLSSLHTEVGEHKDCAHVVEQLYFLRQAFDLSMMMIRKVVHLHHGHFELSLLCHQLS